MTSFYTSRVCASEPVVYQCCLSGPYKGYSAVPASLGNGNGAKPNGKLSDFDFGI